jgi:hypothetical protein
MSHEELRDDDPDYVMIKQYKSDHLIARDCNTPDVVVLMRRARADERRKILRIIADGPSGTAAQRIQSIQPSSV